MSEKCFVGVRGPWAWCSGVRLSVKIVQAKQTSTSDTPLLNALPKVKPTRLRVRDVEPNFFSRDEIYLGHGSEKGSGGKKIKGTGSRK